MLFTADVGNTSVTIVVYDGEKSLFTARVHTDRRKTADQYAYEFSQLLSQKKCDTDGFDGAIISSVVPELSYQIKTAVNEVTGVKPLTVDVGVKTRLQIKEINRGELGVDLLAEAVGAKEKYPMPCLIWDLGTATKISVLDENGVYLGCSISAGIEMCIEALGTKTSKLNPIEISEFREPFGNTTFSAISSGTVVGTAVMLEGLSKRIQKKLGYEKMTVVATGGLSKMVLKGNTERDDIIFDKTLINDGLRYIYGYNNKK